MVAKNILYVVHCIDTEGPLNETLDATFERLWSIFGVKLAPTKDNLMRLQRGEVDLGGNEELLLSVLRQSCFDIMLAGVMLKECLMSCYQMIFADRM